VERAIESYTKAFETLKGSRTLQWKKNLGVVELELDFGERVIALSVSPLQAVLISHFQEQTTWKITCLSSAMGVTASLLRRKLIFWQNKGIVREVAPDEYALIEDQSGNSVNMAILDADEDLTEDSFAGESAKKDRPEDDKFRIYYSYIENMLTNLSDMTLEKIHTTLRMFALQGPAASDLTLPELRLFLEGKVRDGLLTYAGGYYRLSPH
jgi:anaphase-promoting complex subunit 2